MKRSRLHLRVGCALVWKVAVVYASSRTNHPTKHTHKNPFDSSVSDLYYLDNDNNAGIDDVFLPQDESETILVSNVVTQQAEEDEWWMDPLAMFDDEENSSATAANDDHDNLDGLFNDDYLENDETYFHEQEAATSQTEKSNEAFLDDDNVLEMMDDWMMDDETSNQGSSLPDPEEDDLFLGLEEYGLSSANDGESNSYFAAQDEIETALPDELEPVPERQSSTTSTDNDPATETLYDPVAPVQAPTRANFQPNKVSSFFKSPFGTSKKRLARRQTHRSNARYMDPAAATPERGFSPLAPILVIKDWIPQLSNVVSGHPAVSALIVITLAKAVAFFNRDEDPDEKLKAATIRPVKSSTARKRKTAPKRSNGKGNDGEPVKDASGEPVRRVKKPVERPKLDNLERPKNSQQRGGWLRSLVKDTPASEDGEKTTPQPKMRPQERLEDLRRRCEQAELEKANMEREYEKTNWELQETQIELDGLKTSTRHLQAQIMENEEVLDRIVKAERRRARDELQRMKEAMLKVVEEEREAMRSEFMKQAGELQMLMRKKQQDGTSPHKSSFASPSSSHKSSRRY